MGDERERVGRRDFLRLAGLGAGATLAAPAVAGNAKPKIGQRMTDPAGRPQRPWWVKTVDKPTIEIDWDMMERYDETKTCRRGFVNYVTADEFQSLQAMDAKNEKERILAGVPGYTLKDYALGGAHQARVGRSYLGPQNATTPEERGVPKWEGTPEEAAKIVRAAMRHIGAAQVGFVELNENTKKLIYSIDSDGKRINFEDVDQAYETEEKRVIPNKAKWVIVFSVQQSIETSMRAPSVIGDQTISLGYLRGEQVQASTQEFIRGLGYQCLGEASTNALGISDAYAVLAGLGEMGRMNRLVTPEWGPFVRVFKMVTDLPLATDKPIDAGIMKFCKSCKKCAEACPSGAVSFDDEPTWEIIDGFNNAGHKAWFEDAAKCRTYWYEKTGTGCGICFAACPFSKQDKAWIHDWVKAGAATMPVLDGFFRSMDDAFGYGSKKDPAEWWDLDLPEYGIDTMSSVREA